MLTIPPLFSTHSINGGIRPLDHPFRNTFNPFPHLQMTTKVPAVALTAMGITVTGAFIAATVIVPLIQLAVFTAVAVASVAIPFFAIDQLLKAYQNTKHNPPVRIRNKINQKRILSAPTPKQTPRTAQTARIQVESAKKYVFSRATETWLKNCGIASNIDAQTVTLFKQNLMKFNYENSEYNPISDQITLFENIMGLKEVKVEDFNLLKEQLKLSKPPEMHKGDRVLRNCICAITSEYPEGEAVTVPSFKTAVYDKAALHERIRISRHDPQTLKDLGTDQQKSIPELESIIQYRLFELTILKKGFWF